MMLSSTFKTRSAGTGKTMVLLLAASTALGFPMDPVLAETQTPQFSSICSAASVTQAATDAGGGILVKRVPNGPQLEGGVKLTAARGKVPSYCQVTGSYVTNRKTGRTANFIATFPENWNGKYLQLGCSSTCGYLLMNDPAAPPITITAQGYPGQLIEKGYAIFGNDLGHEAKNPAEVNFAWLKKADGSIDDDALEDYLFRADLVMADMGKIFTRQFYRRQRGTLTEIAKSYFSGCSQGGREALIAATRFPEKFDGIIAGSPASDQPGMLWHQAAFAELLQRTAPAKLSTGQILTLKNHVIAQCDAQDGVKDGLIQNPAACNVKPDAGMPICKPGAAADSCLSKQQSQALSVYFSGATTDTGRWIQPGHSISDQGYGLIGPIPAGVPVDSQIRPFVGADFAGKALISTRDGGAGGIASHHGVVNDAAYSRYLELVRQGTILPEDFEKLLARNGKLLWYHNLSDETLTPYMSVNRYKRLSQIHGGYEKVQKNIRFFALPGTGHCGMSGSGPTNFDAIGALEAWVEEGRAPQALLARQLDPATSNVLAGKVDWTQPPVRTMPLCTFPQMASYKGVGDVKDAASWECKASDKRMETVGLSGRNAGVEN